MLFVSTMYNHQQTICVLTAESQQTEPLSGHRWRSCIQVAAGTRQSCHVRHSCQTAGRKQDGHEFPYLSYICPDSSTSQKNGPERRIPQDAQNQRQLRK